MRNSEPNGEETVGPDVLPARSFLDLGSGDLNLICAALDDWRRKQTDSLAMPSDTPDSAVEMAVGLIERMDFEFRWRTGRMFNEQQQRLEEAYAAAGLDIGGDADDTSQNVDLSKTLLLDAINENDWDVVEQLLASSDVDVNELDLKSGQTPLLAASEFGDAELVGKLLAGGAEPNARRVFSPSPLHLLAQRNTLDDSPYGYRDDLEVVRDGLKIAVLLLDAGVPVDTVDVIGQTPLMVAAKLHALSLANLLLNYGADIERRDKFGMTAFLATASFSGLHYPPQSNVAVLEFLLSRGADPHVCDERGRNAFALAIDGGADDHIDFLLAHGVDPTSPDLVPEEALRLGPALAAAMGDVEGVEAALVPGAGPTESMRSPLTVAAARGFANVVHYLLEDLGASPTEADFHQNTPLSLAVRHGHTDVARVLLSHGFTSDTARCLKAAAYAKDDAMVSVFLEVNAPLRQGINSGPSLRDAAGLARPDLLRALFGIRAVLAAEGEEIRLWHAVSVGDREMAETLLGELRAMPEITNNKTWKREKIAEELREAMISASWRGRPELVTWLLSESADVNHQAKSWGSLQETALMAAAEKGHIEIVRQLLAAGANAALRDREGRTAADLAEAKGHQEIIGLLRSYEGKPPVS